MEQCDSLWGFFSNGKGKETYTQAAPMLPALWNQGACPGDQQLIPPDPGFHPPVWPEVGELILH